MPGRVECLMPAGQAKFYADGRLFACGGAGILVATIRAAEQKIWSRSPRRDVIWRVRGGVDHRGFGGHRAVMAFLRKISLLILLLALLPWGAYSAGLRANPALESRIEYPAIRTALPTYLQTADDNGLSPGLLVAKPTRCRTGVLPGSACAMDIDLPVASGSDDATRSGAPPRPGDPLDPAEADQAGLLEPPRSC